MKYVYVLDQEGKPLMPTCRYGKVRRMLQSGQAKVVSTIPFTIQLTYKPKTHVLQQVVFGCDPGRTNIGLAAVREDGTCLYRAHCTTRNKEIVKFMSERLEHRRASRRGERLARKRLAKKLGTTAKKLLNRILPGCSEPLAVKDIINTESRFNNRVRPQGWLTPSATQLLRTHLNLLEKIRKILPATDVVTELTKTSDKNKRQKQATKTSDKKQAIKTNNNVARIIHGRMKRYSLTRRHKGVSNR